MYTQIQKSGKVRFFEKYRDPLTGNQKTVSVVLDKDTTRTRKQAAAILQDKIRQRMTTGPASDITLRELTGRFLRHRRETAKDSSIRRDEWLCKSFCEVLDGDIKVGNLTAAHVYSCLESSGRTPSNRNTIMKRFKTLMRWAYQHDLVNDIGYLEKLKPYQVESKKEKLAEKFLEASELQSVIEQLPKAKWKDLTQFLALTGMRIGEALALTIDDISLESIRITKTRDLISGEIYDSPKTADSFREISVQMQLVPLLKRLRHHALAYSMVSKDRTLFQDEDGPYSYDAYRIAFRRATKAVAGKILTPHSLRHTHTSLLAEQGIPLEVISRRLGHSDSRITKEVYLHVTDGQKAKDRDMLRDVVLF